MSKETIVLGAGMIGVSAAYHLKNRGREVLLIDRMLPGNETSFGNAGLIQREAVQPQPFPTELSTLWRILSNKRIDIRYKKSGIKESFFSLIKYAKNSSSKNYSHIVDEYSPLIMSCTEAHDLMIHASGSQNLVKKNGWIDAFRDEKEFNKAIKNARDIERCYGVQYKAIDLKELRSIEPSIKTSFHGAIHWKNSWSVTDPGALVRAYADAFLKLGGEFVESNVRDIAPGRKGWRINTSDGTREAPELVVAMGPWSAKLLQPLGYSFPLFPVRGYHMHYASQNGTRLNHCVVDYDVGYLLAPMNCGIRLATGAEMAGLNAPADTAQLDAAEKVARDMFPLEERLESTPWVGARPCISDMKPIIGSASKHDDLWLAFGHGHQGFTLGPITGCLLSQMILGETPSIDMKPFRTDRF